MCVCILGILLASMWSWKFVIETFVGFYDFLAFSDALPTISIFQDMYYLKNGSCKKIVSVTYLYFKLSNLLKWHQLIMRARGHITLFIVSFDVCLMRLWFTSTLSDTVCMSASFYSFVTNFASWRRENHHFGSLCGWWNCGMLEVFRFR